MLGKQIRGLACVLAMAWVPALAAEETPEQRDKRMAWWREARFGMFIHWGLYAVPAGEWNGKKVGGIGEWIMDKARIPVSEYEKLVPQFNPVKFNADEWASLAQRAGMKYLVITSKHHDGFCMWDSKLTDYDIMATPFKRDVLKELAEACRKHGVRLGFYHSIMDWHHADQKADFPAYHKHMLGQIRELLTGYGDVAVMWFDGEWIKQWDREKGRELAAFVRSLQPNIIVNNRVGKRDRADGDFGTPEQTIPATGIPGHDWETCMTLNDTWGFKKDDHNWKPTADLLRKLVDIASKGGNFLLNVGPTAEGVIPSESVTRLEEMGKWLAVNGQSVYGTSASPFKRLSWGRCTSKPGRLYLHVFNWPKDGRLTVAGLAAKVDAAYLLADAKRSPLKVAQAGGSLTLDVPAKAPDEIDTVIVLEVTGEVAVAPQVIGPGADGSYTLAALDAATHGQTIRYEDEKNCIGFWTNASDWVSWDFAVPAAGTFEVQLTSACEKGSGGAAFELAVGGSKLAGTVKETGSWTKFAAETVGRIELAKADKATLSIKPTAKPGMGVMNLREVRLVKVAR